MSKFVRKAAITVPSLSVKDMKEGDSIFVRFLSEIEDKPDLGKDGKQKMDADTGELVFLHIAKVEDLTDGRTKELVLGHIVNKELRKVEYVGNCFELVKGAKKGRTNMWEVWSITPQ